MGRYIEDDGSHVQCLGEKVQYWEGGIGMLAGVTCKHPQAAYAGLQKSLQQEWAFVQHATQGTGEGISTEPISPFCCLSQRHVWHRGRGHAEAPG